MGATQLADSVALFLDPNTDADLFAAIALEMPVWIVGTPQNIQLAKSGRQSLDDLRSDWITTFDVNGFFDRTAIAIGSTEMVQLHHPRMTRFHVFGLPAEGERDPVWLQSGFTLVSRIDGHAIFECKEQVFE